MKPPIRLRYFAWLTIALGLFILVQFTAWFIWEYGEYFSGNAESLKKETEELLVILGINLVCLPFMLVFLWKLSSRMIRPLSDITQTATRISRGALKERIPVESKEDELALLAATVNEAFDRYQEANERLQQFSADASHQLRTPLTAIRSTGEVCLQQPREAAAYRETIETMLEQAGKLTKIVERLLLLSRLQPAELQAQFKPTDLAQVLETTSEPFQPSLDDRSMTLEIESQAPCSIQGDEALLQQVVANLLDNALKYTPEGTAIRFTVDGSSGDHVKLTYRDNGPGLSDGLQQTAFERFSRDPQAVGSGTGLGLAIIAQVVKAHQGTVNLLDNTPGDGLGLEMTFPACS